jgi:hypothetical protein
MEGTFKSYWIQTTTEPESCFQGEIVKFDPRALFLDPAKNEKFNFKSRSTESKYEAIQRAPIPLFAAICSQVESFPPNLKFQVYFKPYSNPNWDVWVFGYIEKITHKSKVSYINVKSHELMAQTSNEVSQHMRGIFLLCKV